MTRLLELIPRVQQTLLYYNIKRHARIPFWFIDLEQCFVLECADSVDILFVLVISIICSVVYIFIYIPQRKGLHRLLSDGNCSICKQFQTPCAQHRMSLYVSLSKSSLRFHAQENSTISRIGEIAKALLCW